ncbi:MAG: thioredoxin-disulfide reductase [Planctomycetes bacterium]|nr:thioredoxin-disulfide reductase [Planctomycetota bacterium]
MPETYDIIILGGGPSGLTAGMYASRALLKTILLEKLSPGGQIALTDKVENYPGFPDGVNGYDLAQLMEKQAKKFGLEIANAEVKKIEKDNDTFLIKTDSTEYRSLAVIISTGAMPRTLGITDEGKFTGHGISYCGTCDAPFFKGKEVIVVGGGDTAVEEGLYLTHFANKVTLIHRRDKLRATPIIQQKAFANPKMQFIWNATAESILGKDKITGLKIKDVKNGAIRELPAEGIFVFIGYIPNTGFLSSKIESTLNGKDFLKLDEDGYVIADSEMRTSVKGIFACGDVIKKSLRQVVNACGEGAVAAVNAYHYIEEIKNHPE